MSTLEYIGKKFGLDLCPGFPKDGNPIELQSLDRDGLAALFGELGFKRGAEIGVEQGKYSEVLLKSNPGLKLYCVDAWARYKGYRDHVNQEKLDGFLRATEERLRPYDGVICRGYSQDVVKKFRRQSLDFVYIDANHLLPYVVQDIWQWSERVRPGGIVSGHDYTDYPVQSYRCHVVDAVRAWTACYRISPWFVIGEAYTVRDDGKKMRRNRSWFWVVE